MDKPKPGRSRTQPIHEILVELGSVSREDISKIRLAGPIDDQGLVEKLLEGGKISAEDIAKAVASRNGLEYTDLTDVAIPPAVRALIDRKYQLQNDVVPLELHELSIRVCIADPKKMPALKMELEEKHPGKMIKFLLSTPERVRGAIRGYTHGIKSKDEGKKTELNIQTMWKPFGPGDKDLSEAVFGGTVRQLSTKSCTVEGNLPTGDILRQLTFRKAIMKLNIFIIEDGEPVRAIGHLTSRSQTDDGKLRYDVEFDRVGDGDDVRIKEWLESL